MPMGGRRSRRTDQLGLFEPPRRLPRWEKLPDEARREARRLLARMLREHAMRGEEVADE